MLVLSLATPEGCKVDWPSWLVSCTYPSTNWARREAIALIRLLHAGVLVNRRLTWRRLHAITTYTSTNYSAIWQIVASVGDSSSLEVPTRAWRFDVMTRTVISSSTLWSSCNARLTSRYIWSSKYQLLSVSSLALPLIYWGHKFSVVHANKVLTCQFWGSLVIVTCYRCVARI